MKNRNKHYSLFKLFASSFFFIIASRVDSLSQYFGTFSNEAIPANDSILEKSNKFIGKTTLVDIISEDASINSEVDKASIDAYDIIFSAFNGQLFFLNGILQKAQTLSGC